MFAHTAEFPLAVGGTRRSPKNGGRMVPLFLLSLVAVLCAWRATTLLVEASRATGIAIPAGAYADVNRRASHNGTYRAEVVSASTLQVGVPQRWTVRLTSKGHRRAAHARLQVQTWMPESGEVSPMQATAAYAGDGRYVLDGVLFTRPGWWNVALVVDGRAGVDSLAFNVRLP